jgi:hypothetical protein
MIISSSCIFGNSFLGKLINFNTPGLITLPSWLSFTCASTRTAQISSSTLLLGVSTNQAVVNIYGLQHEPQSTNYSPASNNFTAVNWAQLGPNTPTYGLTDPAGGSTAMSVNASGGPYYSLYEGTSVTATVWTLSMWTKSIGTGNTATIAIADAGGYGSNIAVCTELNQSSLSTAGQWHPVQQTTTTVSKSANYTLLPTGTIPAYSTYAFLQCETGISYATSYIPTTGSTTRAASTLQGVFGSAANPVLDLTFIAGASASAIGACAFLSDGTSTIGLNSSGNLTYNFSGTKTGSNTYSWVSGNTVRVIVKAQGSAGNVIFQLYINGVLQNQETLSNGSSFTFASKTLYLGSVGGTGQYLPAKGYSKIGII